ncbi:MAG TPA: hypothetical protein VL357_06000 [Rariglobus sp.]|jgi:hypothetical protein|nr:hypothetical protein [Rariglobus sp.]
MARSRIDCHQANQEYHFKKRARQRFRLIVSEADYAEITLHIKEDKPGVIFLGYGYRHRTKWRVRWRKRYIVVVFDHHTDRIVTAMKYRRRRWP